MSDKQRVSSRFTATVRLSGVDLDGFDTLDGWSPSEGKLYTVTRAISARINQNYDAWPSSELKKAYRSFLGKPVFVNHVNDDPSKARGLVVAARYVENGEDKFIEVIQEVDAEKFPLLANEIVTGGLDSVSMGCEAKRSVCSVCGNESHSMFDMCDHVANHKGRIVSRKGKSGWEDVLCYETCYDIGFFELSYVFDPADETAVVSNVVTAGAGDTAVPPKVDTLRDDNEDLEEIVRPVVGSDVGDEDGGYSYEDVLIPDLDPMYDIVTKPQFHEPAIEGLVRALTEQYGFVQVAPTIYASVDIDGMFVTLNPDSFTCHIGLIEQSYPLYGVELDDILRTIIVDFPSKVVDGQ